MKLRAFGVILLIGALVTASYQFGRNSAPANENIVLSSEGVDRHPLLSRRIFIENPNDVKINFSPLRTSLREYFSKNGLQGSLYFEYLPTGTSIRINGNDEFRAASLIKLPVAMELYKLAEQGKVSLDHKIQLKEEWLNDGYGDLYKKGAGYELTLRDTVRTLLVDSDNTALRAVISVNDSLLDISDRALGSLDVEFSVDSEGSIDIGARSYASFLKCLYFACYNSADHSQEILNYLSETSFDDRLVAGVPKGITVAHKIGVFNTNVQSDCGIVYLDARNYIMCIMITGDDDDITNGHIAALSKMAFEFTSK